MIINDQSIAHIQLHFNLSLIFTIMINENIRCSKINRTLYLRPRKFILRDFFKLMSSFGAKKTVLNLKGEKSSSRCIPFFHGSP